MSKGSINLPIVSKFDPTGLRHAQTALGSFGNAVKNIGLAAFATASAAAITGIGVAITKGFGRLQQIENARNLLQGIGQDAASVERIMDSALAAVKGTAFGLGDAAGIAATAVAAGVDPATELEGYLRLVADAATVAQVPLDQMGSTLNKVVTIGKAQNDSLRVLAEQGIPVYAFLAEQMGVTEEAVFDLAREGQVSAEMLQQALETNLGGAALNAGNTVEGAFANVGAAISRIGANLLETTYEQLPAFLQGFIDVLEPLEGIASEVGAEIGEAMGPVFDTLLEIFPELVQGLLPLVSLFGELFRTVLPPLLNIFAKLAPIIGRIAEFFANALVMVMPIVVDLFERLWPVVEQLFNALMPIIEAALPVFVELFQLAIDVIMPLVESVLPVLVEIFALLAPIILQLVEAFLPLLEAILPPLVEIFAAFAPLVLALVEAMMPMIEAILPILIDLIELLTPVLGLLAEMIGFTLVLAVELLIMAFEAIGIAVDAMAKWLARGWYELSKAIIGVINKLGPAVIQWANSAISALNGIIKGINALREALDMKPLNLIGFVTFTPIAEPEMPEILTREYTDAIRVNTGSLEGVMGASGATFSRGIRPGVDTGSLEGILAASNMPRLATGGIVRRETLALIGEAGPEAVVPLNGSALGSTYNITVNAGMGTNGTDIGRQIVSEIKKYERTSGKVFASA